MCSSILLSFVSIFIIITLNCLFGRLLSSILFSYFSENCSSCFDWNILPYHFILPNYLSLCNRSVTSPLLEGVALCRKCPAGSSNPLSPRFPSGIHMWAIYVFLCGWATTGTDSLVCRAVHKDSYMQVQATIPICLVYGVSLSVADCEAWLLTVAGTPV